MDLKFAISIIGLALALSIRAESATQKGSVESAYSQVKKQTGSNLLTEVVFSEGKSELSEDARISLRDMLYDAGKKGKISEITVVGWADREYPPGEGDKLSRDDRRLAD